MDEHDYLEDEINQLEIEEMKKYCLGCSAWLGDYYMCMYGGKENCIYYDCPYCDEDIDDDPNGLYWEYCMGDNLDKER